MRTRFTHRFLKKTENVFFMDTQKKYRENQKRRLFFSSPINLT